MTQSIALRSRRLLQRVLETPDLVHAVRALPPGALAALVTRIGVEDSGELVALATTEQLVHLFDEDVFDAEESIDPGRFALWLEVLLEAGDAFAADRIAALPEELVHAAFHEQFLVLDLDQVAVRVQDDEAMSEANDALEAARAEDLDRFLLVAKRADGFDVVWTVVVAMRERHPDLVERLLERLCEASMDAVEDEGLSQVLDAALALAEDATAEREERRTRRGFVSVSDARAFLALARGGEGDPDMRDAITAAWFRRVAPRDAQPFEPATDLEALVLEQGGRPRLGVASGEDPASRLREAMAELAQTDPEAHATRLEELAFLANALSAEASLADRPRRAVEAAEVAMATCGRALARRSSDPTDDARTLRERSLDLLFRDAERSREEVVG